MLQLESKTSSSTGSRCTSESNQDFDVEEIAREVTDIEFPGIDFNQEPLDLNIFHDLGEYHLDEITDYTHFIHLNQKELHLPT
jgi:hypothetical protein